METHKHSQWNILRTFKVAAPRAIKNRQIWHSIVIWMFPPANYTTTATSFCVGLFIIWKCLIKCLLVMSSIMLPLLAHSHPHSHPQVDAQNESCQSYKRTNHTHAHTHTYNVWLIGCINRKWGHTSSFWVGDGIENQQSNKSSKECVLSFVLRPILKFLS